MEAQEADGDQGRQAGHPRRGPHGQRRLRAADPGGRQGRQDHAHPAASLRGRVRQEGLQRLEDRGPGQDPRAAAARVGRSHRPRLQEAGLLEEPGELPAQAGRLGPQRRPRLHRPGRPQHPEPRHEQVRAHHLGRGGRAGGRRAEAREEDLRPVGGALPGRHARRDQAPERQPRQRQPAAVAAGRLHRADAQPRQLGRLELGRQARVGLRAGGRDDAGRQPLSRHRPAR